MLKRSYREFSWNEQFSTFSKGNDYISFFAFIDQIYQINDSFFGCSALIRLDQNAVAVFFVELFALIAGFLIFTIDSLHLLQLVMKAVESSSIFTNSLASSLLKQR